MITTGGMRDWGIYNGGMRDGHITMGAYPTTAYYAP